jgi:HK97 family phage major capsid protein
VREFLNNLIERKQSEMDELKKRSGESQDLNEVRAIGDTLEKLAEEIAETKKQLADLDKEEEQPAQEEQSTVEEERSVIPEGAVLRNAQVVSTFNLGGNSTMENTNLEYRSAFMEFVLRGTPIPAELRADANTLTSDVASVIPTHLVNQIVEKFDKVGMILPLINRTSYAAGVEIPTSALKPEATWVSEGASSDRQKKTTGKVSFTYHKLRCEISMSMEVGTMALSAFEAKFVENVAKAMVKKIEEAIINGTGSGQPKGILKETAPTGQALEITGGKISYADLCAWEAAIPEEYEGTAKWCMSKKTFMSIMAITDQNGQPVGRVNYGVDGKTERTILGRDVVLASKYMPALVAATANTFAFAFDFSDYTLNTIYDMGISKKQDWDTEDLLTKAVMSVDGKVVDKESLVTVSNKVAV